MNYIWQHPAWPVFSVDHHLTGTLAEQLAVRLAAVGGPLGALSPDDHTQVDLAQMVDEAVANAAIEGENIRPEDVRSSVITQLGLEEPASPVRDQRARGMATLQILNRQDYLAPLSIAMLHEWQRLALRGSEQRFLATPIALGRLREHHVQVVSGPVGRETVHYQAPPADQVPAHLDALVQWFNRTAPGGDLAATINPVARAAIVHLWFEAIHPYDDGNGRVGRALAEKALMQCLGGPVLFSLSTALATHREDYYRELARMTAHHGLPATATTIDCTQWASWFGQQILWAIDHAETTIQFVLDKARFWQAHRHTHLNERQRKVLNRLFAAGPEGFSGGLNAAKYMGLTRCSKATATRDLADLRYKGCLEVYGGGRSVRYRLAANV
jgi:Fic family protein